MTVNRATGSVYTVNWRNVLTFIRIVTVYVGQIIILVAIFSQLLSFLYRSGGLPLVQTVSRSDRHATVT